ncbi:MAG: HEPN domain-containing protein [Firmicutes bacterium]|nr:HEPN domain-containing protein [Bacillota bacterium]
MSKNNEAVQEWLKIAYDDYDTAVFLWNKKPRPLQIICYHISQSMEKSLKAFLCFRGQFVPRTHSLVFLCRTCARLDSSFKTLLTICADAEIFSTHTRYPGRIEIETAAAKQALKNTLALYNFAANKINS